MIDTHVHLSHDKFNNSFRYLSYGPSSYDIVQGNRALLWEDMLAHGIDAAIEPAIDLASNHRVLGIAEAHRGRLFPAVGLHPTRTPGVKWADRAVLKALSGRSDVIAIGETGLDLHLPREQQHRLCQIRWFAFLILLAHRRRLPLILHIRQANQMALAILGLFRPFLHGGVAHCFYGDVKTARAFIRLGFCLGIGGTLLQDNAAGETLQETVRQIPLEHLLLETDTPYVHPTCDVITSGKMRSKIRNTSLILPAVVAEIARLKGISPEIVEQETTANAVRTFRLRTDIMKTEGRKDHGQEI